jgi:hypothetical protein
MSRNLYEIQEWLITFLAFISSVGFAMRIVARRDFSRVIDLLVRIYFTVIYAYFALYINDFPMDARGIVVRYGLTALFMAESIYHLFLMLSHFRITWNGWMPHVTIK